MKRKFSLIIAFVFLTMLYCQKEPSEIVNIQGGSSESFSIVKGQTIYFHFPDKDIIKANVLNVDNDLCPSDKNVFCDKAGNIILKLRISRDIESDSVTLRRGTFPDGLITKDSATTIFNSTTYRVYLLSAVYYSDINRIIFKHPHVDVTLQMNRF